MKTRIIRTDIFADDKMLGLETQSRMIAVYLYCNQYIGLIDLYKLPTGYIQVETGYDITSIKISLDKLQEVGIIKHHKYHWIQLLRSDFASLKYSGEKNEKAVDKYLTEIPLEIKAYFDIDTSIDTTSDTSDKSETINHKQETINHKQEKPTISKYEYGDFSNVKLSDEEINKLWEKIGKQNTTIMIDRVDSYCESTGKKYKSHYATILNWVKREVITNNDKKEKAKVNLDAIM